MLLTFLHTCIFIKSNTGFKLNNLLIQIYIAYKLFILCFGSKVYVYNYAIVFPFWKQARFLFCHQKFL